MANRDNHYEAAFGEYLRARGVPYVAVDEARRSLLADGASIKSLDFIVSSAGPAVWLVDVKGRRFPSGDDESRHYWKNWSTRDDLTSLARWEALFGENFQGLFVFAYHILGVFTPATSPDAKPVPMTIACYRCPSDPASQGETNYVMIVGPHTISNGPNSVRLKDIADGPANTIAVVETYGLGIRWYEPADLRAEEITFRINDPEYFGIASRHPGGVQVGLIDGSVRFLPDDTDPRAVEAATTIHGGDSCQSW